ncbi:hypothetical protein MCUN1_002512 [Malassezia cuniculi]|uniref:Shq1 protein domain-containing protein n=1 Tax=Malassezia cuniculi TaxID=948313 RepID=A0AAF0J7H5_9BASI|nr:hypothetical protein MCUN1_002512 [Malassezia cuniculi]
MDLTTPTFALSQDDASLTVRIDLRGATTNVARVVAQDKTFGCFAEPLYLPLSLPADVEELEDKVPVSGTDDAKEVCVRLVKRVPAQWDMAQVVPQLLSHAEMDQLSRDAEKYTQGRYSVGLTSYYRRIPSDIVAEFAAKGTVVPFLDIPDPENYSLAARVKKAEQLECEKWDEGMFLDATMDQDGYVSPALGTKTKEPAVAEEAERPRGAEGGDDQMPQSARAEAFLVELLFAYVYEVKASYGDMSSESAWTICKLCRSLTCFTETKLEDDVDLLRILRASYRRALTYPLYRSWKLCDSVRLHVAERLTKPHARAFVSMMLRDIDTLFFTAPAESGAPEIVCQVLAALWQLWMAPLQTWLATTSDDELHKIGEAVRAFDTSLAFKEHVGTPGDWDIDALEHAAAEELQGNEGGFI